LYVKNVLNINPVFIPYFKKSGKSYSRNNSLRFLERREGMYFHVREKGQGLVEYALIFVLVVLIVVVLLPLFAPWVNAAYNNVINNI